MLINIIDQITGTIGWSGQKKVITFSSSYHALHKLRSLPLDVMKVVKHNMNMSTRSVDGFS